MIFCQSASAVLVINGGDTQTLTAVIKFVTLRNNNNFVSQVFSQRFKKIQYDILRMQGNDRDEVRKYAVWSSVPKLIANTFV